MRLVLVLLPGRQRVFSQNDWRTRAFPSQAADAQLGYAGGSCMLTRAVRERAKPLVRWATRVESVFHFQGISKGLFNLVLS